MESKEKKQVSDISNTTAKKKAEVQPSPAIGWETLKPHLWFEESETPGQPSIFILHIFCKKDTATQTMTLVRNEAPKYGGNMRVIEIIAQDLEWDGGDHDYHVFIEIKQEDRQVYEDLVYVEIDHEETPHGGSGSIHYPGDDG